MPAHFYPQQGTKHALSHKDVRAPDWYRRLFHVSPDSSLALWARSIADPVIPTPNNISGVVLRRIRKSRPSQPLTPICPGGRSSKIRNYQELIRTALKQNYDLQLATERINAARAQLAVTRSSLFPQVSSNANFNGGKENIEQSKYNFLTLTADAAFQF